MSTSISYKVTNIGVDQDLEVRRFLVSQEVEVYGSFKHLQVKLLSIFPKLKMGNFSIFWTDNERDEVTIASDDDLYIALAEMNGPVNKLTVRTKREDTSEEDSAAGEEEVAQSREDYQQWSGVFADNTRSGASTDTFGQSTNSQGPASQEPANQGPASQGPANQGPANQVIPSVILTIMQFFGVNPNGYYGYFQPTENSASGSQCPFATPTYHSRNCFCRQPNIIKFIASQFLKISAMFTKASITMSSLMMMLFILMILPSFLINSALYLAFAASLGLPLGTLITGHLLYALISCSPTFLVASGSIWAFHRVIVQRKPLLDVDLELWRRKFEVFRTRIQEQQ